jgi:hypothetical protein
VKVSRDGFLHLHDSLNLGDALVPLEDGRPEVDRLRIRCLDDVRNEFIPLHCPVSVDIDLTKQRIDAVDKIVDLIWLVGDDSLNKLDELD